MNSGAIESCDFRRAMDLFATGVTLVPYVARPAPMTANAFSGPWQLDPLDRTTA
ncbi:hypothetical protein [Rhizobium mongolense]|uniref:hypothetical protein n=1 Tax=Rhizobium mongolense TaxID=57676 RepID=UPI0034A10B68